MEEKKINTFDFYTEVVRNINCIKDSFNYGYDSIVAEKNLFLLLSFKENNLEKFDDKDFFNGDLWNKIDGKIEYAHNRVKHDISRTEITRITEALRNFFFEKYKKEDQEKYINQFFK